MTGVTQDPLWKKDVRAGDKGVWTVNFIRNKNPNWMYVFATDELSAYQAAQKRLDAMDKKEDEGERHAKRSKNRSVAPK